MEREAIFRTLRSFDPHGLDAPALEAATLALLRPGFSDAAAVHAHITGRVSPVARPPLPDANLAEADAILRNEFSFYGEIHDLGPVIDWEHNPGTDHWGHDLNRFHFLHPLAAAHEATGDARYGRKGAELILDWATKNEVANSWFWFPDRKRHEVSPYVWSSYLNQAVHLVAWSHEFDRWAGFWTPAELLRGLKSVHDQLAYLEQVIPTGTNNWVVIGCWGICEMAARLIELRDAHRLLDFGLTTLAREAERQVGPDGVQFELTPHYHHGVAEWICQSLRAAQQVGVPVPTNLESVTARMLDYDQQTVTPDDKQVAFNDSDPDCGPRVRRLLASEGRARARADWRYVGTRGAEGEEPAVRSQAFPCAGVIVFRSGWTPGSTVLAFDGGPAGYSHRHWDRLGFWLCARGRSLLVDPGRYLYDAHNPFTPYLRRTEAHSTITVDGEGQADADFPDTWAPSGPVPGNRWDFGGVRQQAAASHSLGYGPLGRIAVTHRRSITAWLPDIFLVLDELRGDGEHAIESRLQFAPGTLQRDGAIWRTGHADANIAVRPFATADWEADMACGSLDPVSGWYSDGVNRIEPSPTLTVRVRGALPVRMGFLIAAYSGAAAPDLDVVLEGDRLRLRAGPAAFDLDMTEALA